jgi:hypothetical protein
VAERLENIDLRSFPPRHQSNPYPWFLWMDDVTATSEKTLGVCWRLYVPQDFDCDVEAMRRLVHATAKKHGIKACTRLVPKEEKALDIQFWRPVPDEDAG